MRRTAGARLVASGWLLIGAMAFGVLASVAVAQTSGASGDWNDARSRALVELATRRRAEQLADTGLADYRANARGYVTLLVSMGSGFLEAPKVVKTDQLALEVYWHAPNLSKQRIVGRRDTLLLPTDIQYHRDHLGIVQNNFPDFIRIGDGDEVGDVPHPLSTLGLALYDFRLSEDSVRIRLPGRVIDLLEIKVRPKNDREARVIGAIYIDPTEGQVVRMAFNFTRASFLDKELEDLAVVLENRLVGGRFWLPSRQEIEIRRTGTWLDYPVRGIIRGRWEIEDYQFNLALPVQTFAGAEIVIASPQELKKYPWHGTIMDSLPENVKATVDPDIKRVLDEARVLVRAQALQRMQAVRLSAPHASDFVRVNRVEGLAIGGGLSSRLISNLSFVGRARYGIDDKAGKGTAQLRWELPSGSRWEVFASRDFTDIGDQPERSTVVNSLAAQEFGSDLSDPYRVDAYGVRGAIRVSSMEFEVRAAAERHAGLLVHAIPMSGTYLGTLPIGNLTGRRLSVTAFRPLSDFAGLGLWEFSASLGSLTYTAERDIAQQLVASGAPTLRGVAIAEHRSTRGAATLLIREHAGAVIGGSPVPAEELIYFGGPWSAPGYLLHSIAGKVGSSTRVELQLPVPFVSISLGRFGRIPGQAHLAPYVNNVIVAHQSTMSLSGRGDGPCTWNTQASTCTMHGSYPSVGVGLLTGFDALRFDVARAFRPGRWMFNVDVSRDFWSIL